MEPLNTDAPKNESTRTPKGEGSALRDLAYTVTALAGLTFPSTAALASERNNYRPPANAVSATTEPTEEAEGDDELQSINPGKITVKGAELELNGSGVRTVSRKVIFTEREFEVFRGELFLESKSRDAKEIIDSAQIKQLKFTFVRNVGVDAIREAAEETWQKSGSETPELKDRIRKFNSGFTDMNRGDHLTITFSTNASGERETELQIRDKARAVIKGQDFEKALLSHYIGPKPIQASLKEGLLGKRR